MKKTTVRTVIVTVFGVLLFIHVQPAVCVLYTISGNVSTSGGTSISGVTMNGFALAPITDANGNYSALVGGGWDGMVTPTKAGYSFSPSSRSYVNVAENKTNQNYTGTPSTSVELISQTNPGHFLLSQNYPNPFNPETVIFYSIPERYSVVVEVYNIQGNRIATLKDALEDAGNYSIVWNGKDNMNQAVPGGIYLCRIQAGQFQKTIRMLMLK